MAQFSFRYGVNELWLGVGVTVAWTVLMAAATFLALIFLDRENPLFPLSFAPACLPAAEALEICPVELFWRQGAWLEQAGRCVRKNTLLSI